MSEFCSKRRPLLLEVNWPHNFNNCNHHSFLVVTTARPSRTPLSLLRPEPSIERKSAPEVSFLNFVIIRTNVVSDPIFYIFFFKQTCFPVFFKLDIFIKILFPSPSLCFVIVKNCRIFSYSFLKVPNFSLITQTIDIFNKESLVSLGAQGSLVTTFATAGTCDGGIFTFEKTTGHFLRTGRETALELSSNTPGITKECVLLCLGKGKE